jgi:hypothetical protein
MSAPYLCQAARLHKLYSDSLVLCAASSKLAHCSHNRHIGTMIGTDVMWKAMEKPMMGMKATIVKISTGPPARPSTWSTPYI